MKEKEFLENVFQMRRWQKEYFKTRAFHALEKARDYERKVDKALDEFKNPSLGI